MQVSCGLCCIRPILFDNASILRNQFMNQNSETTKTTFELTDTDDYLIAWISNDSDHGEEIHLYGNPNGLRSLAAKLIAMADYHQPYGAFPDNDSNHHHYNTGFNTCEAEKYPRLTIGRVDEKHNLNRLRDCFPPVLEDVDKPAII